VRLKAYSRLITHLARQAAGSKQVTVELGSRGFLAGVSFFPTLAQSAQSDLFDFAPRSEWEKLEIPQHECVADFYVSAGRGINRELACNLTVIFRNGKFSEVQS